MYGTKYVKQFKKGQVWLWEDPVFGSKKDDAFIPQGECTQRYSRYVIIIQNTETISYADDTDGDPILVVPVTKSRKGSNLIPLKIRSLVNDKNYCSCNAKCGAIFPVSSKMLVQYHSDISDDEMSAINRKIAELIGTGSGVKVKTGRPPKWTPEAKKMFIREYERNSSSCAIKYKISDKSAYNYYRKFSAENIADVETKNTSADRRFVVDPQSIKFAISKAANLMAVEIINEINISTEFQRTVSCGIFYGIIDFLQIKLQGGQLNFINASSYNRYQSVYNFLKMFYNDNVSRNMLKFSNAYKYIAEKYDHVKLPYSIVDAIVNGVNKKVILDEATNKKLTSFITTYYVG